MIFLKSLGLEGLNIKIQENYNLDIVGESAGDILNNMLDIVESSFDLSMESSMLLLNEDISGSFSTGFEADETDTEEQKDSKLAAIASKVKAFADKVWKFIRSMYTKIKHMIRFVRFRMKSNPTEEEIVEYYMNEFMGDITDIFGDMGNATEETIITDEERKAMSKTYHEMRMYMKKELTDSPMARKLKHWSDVYINNPIIDGHKLNANQRVGSSALVMSIVEVLELLHTDNILVDFKKFQTLNKKFYKNPSKANVDIAFAFLKDHTNSFIIGLLGYNIVQASKDAVGVGEKIIARYENMSAEQLAKNGVTVEDISRFKEEVIRGVKLVSSSIRIISLFNKTDDVYYDTSSI